ATSPHIVLEACGPPIRFFIAQDRQAEDRSSVPLINPEAVDEHPLRKCTLAPALHFNMNQQPRFLAVLAPDLEQLVSQPLADLGFPDDLLQFLIEAFVATAPVDAGVDLRKAKGQEGFKEMFQRLFPGAVQLLGLALRRRHGGTVPKEQASL